MISYMTGFCLFFIITGIIIVMGFKYYDTQRLGSLAGQEKS